MGSLLFCTSCSTKSVEELPDYITVSEIDSNRTNASDILALKGFTILQDAGIQPLRSISKILFTDNSIIILDAETDFQDIYRYELSTGNYINKIGRQSELEGGYNELYDIDLNIEKNQIIGFSTGNTSFMMYDFQGNLVRQMRHGALGEGFAVLPDGGYVIYNEFGATKISGYNFLVFYDKQGNVVKQALPYPKSLDNIGYRNTDFLRHSGQDIVFSPPFSDTLYAIRNKKIVPIHIFDFMGKAVPDSMRLQQLTSDKIINMSYLAKGVVTSKNLTLFRFVERNRARLGIFNDTKKLLFNDRFIDKNDPLNELIEDGEIFPKGNNQFALVLDPSRIYYLARTNWLKSAILAERYPDLKRAIEESVNTSKYILLYFEAK